MRCFGPAPKATHFICFGRKQGGDLWLPPTLFFGNNQCNMKSNFHIIFACFWCSFCVLACDVISTADGCFDEAQDSGRIVYASSIAPMHFYRLNMSQYNEKIAGTVEIFTLPNYATFLQQPSVVTTSSENYFCSRLDDGYRNNNDVFVQFTDFLNRRWVLNAKLNDTQFSGTIYRRDANNIPIYYPQESCEPLLAEDANYRNKNGKEDKQIVFEQSRKSIPEQKLDCIDYYVKSTFYVKFPSILPACNHYRLALITTRLQNTEIVNQPVDSIGFIEYATATLDRYDIEQNNNTRTFVFRTMPRMLLKQNPKIAAGTLVMYEDLPPYNDRWDNIINPETSEPLLAYLPNQVLIFHDMESYNDLIYPRKSDYSLATEALTIQEWPEKPGWYVYHFVAESINMLNFKTQLIQKIQREDSPQLQLKGVPDTCKNCYLSKQAGNAQCMECPSVFMTLSL